MQIINTQFQLLQTTTNGSPPKNAKTTSISPQAGTSGIQPQPGSSGSPTLDPRPGTSFACSDTDTADEDASHGSHTSTDKPPAKKKGREPLTDKQRELKKKLVKKVTNCVFYYYRTCVFNLNYHKLHFY